MEKQGLSYNKLSPEEMKARGILGELSGYVADVVNPTRNGRRYSEQLWERVFKDPIVNEYFKCGGLLGELNHPADREETDLSKVCVCMPEPPQKKDGKLFSKFHILDTPNGRILKTLCDYGYKIGVSSRGSGDIITDYDGQESVDPETYTLQGWDVVLLPAVEAARMDYSMNESLNTKKTLRQALTESLNKASADDRKVMEETINELHLLEDDCTQDECPVDNTKEEVEEGEETESVGNSKDEEDGLIEQLQSLLKSNSKLQEQVIELQEKLSVSYTKETKLEEQLSNKRNTIVRLSKDAKRVKPLEEKINALEKQVDKQKYAVKQSADKAQRLQESIKSNKKESQQTTRDMSRKNEEIHSLKESIKQLNSDRKMIEESYNQEKDALNEQIENLNKDMALNKKHYSQKLEKSNKLVEKYKSIATGAVNKYIDSQAIKLGISPNEIKNKLPESYNFEDIDKICEDLQEYKLNMSRLPFSQNHNMGDGLRVNITAPKESLTESVKTPYDDTDEVDDMLLQLARL